MMRWTRHDIYNAIRDCARHMQGTTEGHYQAMFRVVDYVIATPERELFLAPKGDWDGKDLDFELEIAERAILIIQSEKIRASLLPGV